MNKVLFITFVHRGYRYLKSLFNFSDSDVLPKLYIHWLFHFHPVYILISSGIVIFQRPPDLQQPLVQYCFLLFKYNSPFRASRMLQILGIFCCTACDSIKQFYMAAVATETDEPQSIPRSFTRRCLYHTTNYDLLRSILTLVNFPVNDLLFLSHHSLGEHTVLNKKKQWFLNLFIKLSLDVKFLCRTPL